MPNRATQSRSGPRVVYVAAGRLAAAQWRCQLAREALADGRRVVIGTEVVPYRAFAASLWEARRPPGEPMLLSPRQSRVLWRRVVAESPESDGLLGAEGPARWAEEAWRTAAAFRIDLDALRRGPRGTDVAVFSSWARAYRERLRDSGWIDDALLDGMLALRPRAAARPLVLADLDPTPAQHDVLAGLRAAGTRVDTLASPAVTARTAALSCADPAAELAAAAEWAAGKCATQPSDCFAIVVPELAERSAEVRRILTDALDASGAGAAGDRLFIAGERIGADDRPLLGAALNALELLTPAAGFAALSRWLRSPFFHDEATRGVAAAFERRLREDVLAHVPFLDAWRGVGLAARMRKALPDAAARIDAALARLAAAPRGASPAAWAALWPGVLDALGGAAWAACRRLADAEHAQYEEALVELARLTPIVGTLTASEALAELEAGMTAERSPALPLAGVHVVASVEDVGPGYAGVWVTGATDDRLPRPVELRPFLPPAMQIDAGMPWSSPRDALERSRALLKRLHARVPEVIYSWPKHIRDEPAEPSPLLAGIAAAEPRLSDTRPRLSDTRPRLRAAPARELETISDPAPPLPGDAVPGGTAALNLESICPLRAFCEHRLGARPLATIERGVTPAQRGKILHRTLERMFRRFDSRAALERAGAAELRAAARREATRAATEIIGRGHKLLDALVEIEAARAVDVVAAFTARELERAPFDVRALEQVATLEIGGRTLRVRIDRIDALGDDGIAVIDYKSGTAPRPSDWQGPRLRDVQLPVYAAAMAGEPLVALVVAVLRTDRALYSGLWDSPEAFPGRGRAGMSLQLADLRDAWREGIRALVDEYASGDARLFVDGAEYAAGAYAPLTRVYELLAAFAAPTDRGEAG